MTSITERMMREEWRMHSEMFSGRSFAFFPAIIFGLTSAGVWLTVTYSTLQASAVNTGLVGLGAFFGLSVGAIGFSSSDAMKNVLGPTNFLVYSSRTLPVSERRLLAAFLAKDLIYYSLMFLAPVAAASVIFTSGSALTGALNMYIAFFLSLIASVSLAKLSLGLPGFSWSYGNSVSPLVDKTVVDVLRSTGGLLKVMFSLTVLTGFYWFAAIHFPLASVLLENPVLSFSVLIGTVTLSVYNWINRFDDLDDYTHLPVDRAQLLLAKQKAFLLTAIPLTLMLIFASSLVYNVTAEVLAISALLGVSVELYTVGLASYFTGLKPNSRLFDSKVFLKFIAANTAAVVPLVILTLVYPSLWMFMVSSAFLVITIGVLLNRYALRK